MNRRVHLLVLVSLVALLVGFAAPIASAADSVLNRATIYGNGTAMGSMRITITSDDTREVTAVRVEFIDVPPELNGGSIPTINLTKIAGVATSSNSLFKVQMWEGTYKDPDTTNSALFNARVQNPRIGPNGDLVVVAADLRVVIHGMLLAAGQGAMAGQVVTFSDATKTMAGKKAADLPALKDFPDTDATPHVRFDTDEVTPAPFSRNWWPGGFVDHPGFAFARPEPGTDAAKSSRKALLTFLYTGAEESPKAYALVKWGFTVTGSFPSMAMTMDLRPTTIIFWDQAGFDDAFAVLQDALKKAKATTTVTKYSP